MKEKRKNNNRSKKSEKHPRIIYTIGHSTHSLKEFIDLLLKYKIEHLIDVRSIPYSFYTPQFNKEALKKKLMQIKIRYTHMKGLGGLKHPKKSSQNMGWRNLSFRGYADYMQTKVFKKNLERLVEYALKKTTAIMCAESLPWRCHRSLIGDFLTIKKFDVEDIFSLTIKKPHKLTPFARKKGGFLFYPENKP